MQQLQQKQAWNQAPKIKANKDSNYEIFKHDEHLVHALMYIPDFHPTTGVDRSIKRVQNFSRQEFERLLRQHAFDGETVEIIHEPKDKIFGEIDAEEDAPEGKKIAKTAKKVKEDKQLETPAVLLPLDQLKEAYKQKFNAEVPEGATAEDLMEILTKSINTEEF